MIILYFSTIIFEFLTKLTHCLFFRRIFPVISAGCIAPPGTDLVNPAEAGCPLRSLLRRIILACLHTDRQLGMKSDLQEFIDADMTLKQAQVFFEEFTNKY